MLTVLLGLWLVLSGVVGGIASDGIFERYMLSMLVLAAGVAILHLP